MKAIIEKILTQKLQKLPNLPAAITKDDAAYVAQALQKNMGKKVQSNVLKLILSECYEKLGNKEFIKPLLDVIILQIQDTPIAIEAKLRICEGIIKADNNMRAHTIQNYLKQFENTQNQSQEVKARMQSIRSGLHFLNKQYLKAASKSLSASRFSYYNQKAKMQFIEKAIAYAFISDKNAEQHQIICSLYVNEYAKKSLLYQILTKLYSEQMITVDQINPIKNILPPRITQKDSDNVSTISQAIFAHNMICILKSFSCVSLETVSQLISVPEEQILLMIEKTYRNGQLEINLDQRYIKITDNNQQQQILFKKWFQKIDTILALLNQSQETRL